MEEDTEVLDWSNEDDEAQALESLRSQAQQKQTDSGATWSGGDQEEAEDAVSLGGDEDEEVYPYAVAEQPREHTPKPLDSPPRAPSQSRSSVEPRYDSQRRDDYDHSRSLSPRKTDPFQPYHSQPLGKLTHALPPKPSVAPPPYIPPTTVNPGILASSMITRERRSNGHSKQSSNPQDSPESLPPDWEMRNARGGDREREVDYYNVRTHEATWAKPRTLSSRRSSPSRERVPNHMQSSGARSPVRDLTDENVRGTRKDTRRHVSPGGNFGYGDRHYRSEEQSSSDQQFARRDSLSTSPVSSHMRQPSPSSRVPNERRGARSPSPPPRRRGRSVERSGRGSRRDISPSATDRTSWRELPRDDRRARQSPVQGRAWTRPRDSSPVDADAARPYDKRSAIDRGRRHRADIEPPLPTPQDARNSATFEFSAPRRKSTPPHSRIPPAELPQRPPSPRNRDRSNYDPSRPTGKDQSHSGSQSYYTPTDRVPQRRVRDFDSDYGSEAKRRRVDQPLEDTRYRPPASGSPYERSSHHASTEQSRARRTPLPSQSDRFRQVTQYPQQPGSVSSTRPVSYMAQNEADAPSAQMSIKDNEVPSGPRNHAQVPQPLPDMSAQDQIPHPRVLSFTGRPYNPPTNPLSNSSFEPYTPPAWKLGRPRTLYDPQPPASSSPVTTNQVKDAIDVDYPPRLKLPEANNATFRSSNVRTEYPADPSMGSVPTGPRAMSRSISGIGTQKRSPDASTPPVPAVGQSSSRRALSHPSRTPSPPLGFEWQRVPGSKYGPWTDAESQISGTNNVPLGVKGRPPGYTAPVTWKHPNTIIYQTESHRAPINHVHISPTTHHKSLPPDSGTHRKPSIVTSGVPDKGFPGSSAHPISSQPPPADKSPKVPRERSGRPSRFGPEPTHSIPPPPPPPRTEERVWLTREESQRLERDAERNEPHGQVKSPVLARKQNATYNRLPPGERPLRQYEQPQGRSQQGNQDRYPDSRQRGRPSSLERRLSSKVYSSPHLDPPRSYSNRNGPVGVEDTRQADRPVVHRKSAHLSRSGPDVNEDEPERGRDASPGPTKVHPDRVRLISDPPPDERDRRSEDRRSYPQPSMHPHPSQPIERSPTSKPPVRLRRPGTSPVREDSYRRLERSQHAPISIHDFEPIPPQHQPIQRGGSLLDRLTLDSPPPTLPGPSPSLRDRVELPMKRVHEDPHGLPPRPPAEVTNDMDSGFDGRGRGNGRKRGSGKLKRGRK